jgi:hypothetical protein
MLFKVRHALFIPLLAVLGTIPLAAQSDEDFKVYSDPPRLLLTKQRLRLAQREKERQSMRWEQFDALMTSGPPLPEPGFALSLYYRVTNQAAAGKKAVEWALADKSTDLRQLAFVFDWCGPAMTKPQSAALAQKIQKLLAAAASDSASSQDARALAAIAIADQLPDQGEKILKGIVDDWWRAKRLKNLAAGRPPLAREETYAAYELFHVLRDNVKIDLRDSESSYFEKFPIDHLVSHYPAPFPAQENEYRVPAYTRNGDPDIAEATMSRAAELAMVAFDNNATEVQFVQGWLMQDRFLMRGALGLPYEFLWANPYQPGLSYAHVPLVFHDDRTGRVFARTSWDEDATWIGYFDGQLQLFRDGQVQVLKSGSAIKPVEVGQAMLLSAPAPSPDGTIRFQAGAASVFLFGLAPRTHYDVEVDDQELSDEVTDVGGTLLLKLPPETEAGIRVRKRLQ